MQARVKPQPGHSSPNSNMEGQIGVPVSKKVLGSNNKMTGTPIQNNNLKTSVVERFMVGTKNRSR